MTGTADLLIVVGWLLLMGFTVYAWYANRGPHE